MTGKIYFVSAPGRIKIGYTANPDQRLAKLRHVDMEELETIAVVDGTRRAERKLHGSIAKYRLRGEWFKDCHEVRAAMDTFLKTPIADERPERPGSVLDEAAFVEVASNICGDLIAIEKRNGATSSSAISLVAIKTGISHGRVWAFYYRKPNFVTAAEIHSLRKITGPDSPALRAAKALMGKDTGEVT